MPQYLTTEKYEELKKKVQTMKNAGRAEVAARLKAAKALGDLTENADYQEAREEQSTLERQIRDLEEVLRGSKIIARSDSPSEVEVGSTVALVKDDTEHTSFTIVGSREARPHEGLISNESPIGALLLGKRVGDVVQHKTKNGVVKYAITAIR